MTAVRLEVLRQKLYEVLEETGMDYDHPEVIEASIDFDRVLNRVMRRQLERLTGMAPELPSKALQIRT